MSSLPCWYCGDIDENRNWADPHCRICDALPQDGTPNVQKAIEERPFLESRYEKARSSISQAGYEHLLDAFASLVTRTRVVVAMPLGWAVLLLSDRKQRYVSYGVQVDGGTRLADSTDEDNERTIIDRFFYGRHGKLVVHGALSLDGLGACSFGEAHLTLKDVAIDGRATVTEEDSFKLANRHVVGPQRWMPPGYIATWAERHKLAATKYEQELSMGQDLSVSSTWIIRSEPAPEGERAREAESFFEVHIYDGFRRESVCEAQVRIATDARQKTEDPACAFAEAIAINSLRAAAGKIGVPMKERPA